MPQIDAIAPRLKASSDRHLLEQLAELTAPTIKGDEQIVFEKLFEREQLGSTGLGDGCAIPHARIAGLDRVYMFFARLNKPVSFDAIDDQPVDLCMVLLSPPEAGADHLTALAEASRILRDQALCKKLRGSEDEDAIRALLEAHARDEAA